MADKKTKKTTKPKIETGFPKGPAAENKAGKWKMTTLGEVGKILNGSTPSTKEDCYWDGNIPWITPKDLSGYSVVYVSKGERNITEEGLKNSSAQRLPTNTILFSAALYKTFFSPVIPQLDWGIQIPLAEPTKP